MTGRLHERRLPLPTLLSETHLWVLRKLLADEAAQGRPLPTKAFRRALPSDEHRDALGPLSGNSFVEATARGYRLCLRGVLVQAGEPQAARWISLCNMCIGILAAQYHSADDARATATDVFAQRTIPDATLSEVERALTHLADTGRLFGGLTSNQESGYVAQCTLVEGVGYAESIEALVARGKLFADAFELHERRRAEEAVDPFATMIREAADECSMSVARLGTHAYLELSKRVEQAGMEMERGWSGSWIGYHARVYLEGLRPRHADEHFDIDFGLQEAFSTTTAGPWREHTDTEVADALLKRAGVRPSDLEGLRVVAREVESVMHAVRTRVLPVLAAVEEAEPSPRLAALRGEIEKLSLRLACGDLIGARRPKQIATRDVRAYTAQRIESPPHLVTAYGVFEQMSVRLQGEKLRDLLVQAAGVLDAKATIRATQTPIREVTMPSNPKSVFVVHGRNLAARDAMHGFLRALGLAPLEWDELVARTGKGSPYNAEVIEEAFKTAQAVVILFTGDDQAKLDDALLRSGEEAEKLGYQPRPNVLIEAGMAMQRDRARTLIVRAGITRHPSDFDGLNAVIYDHDDHDFRNRLRTRLKTAHCDVNDGGSDWLRAGDFKTAFARAATPKPAPLSDAAHAAVASDLAATVIDVSGLLFRGSVETMENDHWVLRLIAPLGDHSIELADAATRFQRIGHHYVALSKPGIARGFVGPPTLRRDGQALVARLAVRPEMARKNARTIPQDIDLKNNSEGGRTAGGLADVPRILSLVLSSAPGEWLMSPHIGSFVALYAGSFKEGALLADLVAVEIARLAFVPPPSGEPPLFPFVRRVRAVEVVRDEGRPDHLDANLDLDLDGVGRWTGHVEIFVGEATAKQAQDVREWSERITHEKCEKCALPALRIDGDKMRCTNCGHAAA